MPPQAIALALAASIYPPAVAAVIGLGRGSQVRSRVLAFVLAAAAVTYTSGVVMLFALSDLGATGSSRYTPSATVDLVLGVLLIGLAVRLRRKRADGAKADGTSKIERYLQSRRLAFVLGLTLYVLPSPIYIGAVKAIADGKSSTSSQLLYLATVVAAMLWLIELPMLMLFAVPDRASETLERVNAWFGRRGRSLAVIACAAVGVYLIVRGTVGLAS